ncbi:MAG: phosphopentomutase [Lachnospiraceae bacterium]|nr:phosphopentomutase [Lachnospiraceae bacterium]
MAKRVIWIILDSVGIGEAPDADKFDDLGADTLGHIYERKREEGFSLPNLEKLGLGMIDGVNPSIGKTDSPKGIYLKCAEKSAGKDTTIGHWEMTGIITPKPFPTFPDGFPKDVIDEFIAECKVPGVLGNKVASGTEIIKELGSEHIRSGKPIVYTSADSVYQIACHTDVYPIEQLYAMCEKARHILQGENAVARVIARPFAGNEGEYYRTSDRRDFSLKPNENNLLVHLKNNGIPVFAVGKIEDIFAGVGISEAVHTKNNMDGVDKTIEYMKNKKEECLIFTNLVEFDSTWGHRRDVEGYAKGLADFDDRLGKIMELMGEDDLLVINADHGCDPTYKGTDHTREFIPVLMYGKNIAPANAHTGDTFANIGATIGKYFGVDIPAGREVF